MREGFNGRGELRKSDLTGTFFGNGLLKEMVEVNTIAMFKR